MNTETTITTPREQRIAIAEACGWKCELTPFERHASTVVNPSGAWWHPDVAGCSFNPPDYLNDLNAMHEAEKTLDANLEAMYYDRLCSIAGVTAYRATAAQRAEAFLRTIQTQAPKL